MRNGPFLLCCIVLAAACLVASRKPVGVCSAKVEAQPIKALLTRTNREKFDAR